MEAQALIDSLAMPALSVDADGTIVGTNPTCRDVFKGALQPGISLARIAVGLDVAGLRRRRLPDLDLVLVHGENAPIPVRPTLLPLREGPLSVLLLERRSESAAAARKRTLDHIDAVARTINTIRHELAGTIQTLMNGPFIARRALSRSTEEGLAQLEAMDEQIGTLVERLRSFDRLPMAMRTPDASLVDVAELLRVAAQNQPRLRVEAGTASEYAVWGDPAQLGLALSALVQNALEHSPETSAVLMSIAVSDSRVAISIDDAADASWCSAVDSIYDPFYTSKHRNLGLGLSIAFVVATRHEADLTVGARPDGAGTRATLSIPRRGPAASADREGSAEAGAR